MKLNRKAFGRVATTFVATAMLAAFAAVPASADVTLNANQFAINKKFTVEENTFRPKADFTFTVTAANDVTAEQEKEGIFNGVAGAVTMTQPASFTADSSETPSTNLENNTKAIFDVTLGEGGITHAGVYKYTVTEDKTNPIKGVTYDSTTYNLYVSVKNDQSNTPSLLSVESCQLTKIGTDGAEEKVNGFANTYDNDTDNDGDPDFYKLTVTKTMDGTGADLSAEFEFNISITGSSKENTTRYYYTAGDGETGYILSDGTPKQIYLSKDETVTIYGLLNEDQYAIIETNAGDNGYKTEMKKEDETDYIAYDANSSTMKSVINVADTNNDKTVNVYVQNSRSLEDIPTTGVLLNVAPYVLMVGIAVAGCFVFLRKRRDD